MDENICMMNYCIFQPITRALSIQKGSEIVKKKRARYTLEKVLENTVLCIKHNFQLFYLFLCVIKHNTIQRYSSPVDHRSLDDLCTSTYTMSQNYVRVIR